MKKFLILCALSILFLAACEREEVVPVTTGIVRDYTVFSRSLSTYEESETIEEELYAVYYYDSTDSRSNDVYESFYTAYKLFDTFNLYVLDTAELVNSTSVFGEYIDKPIIYLVRDNKVEKTFSGEEGVSDFFQKYTTLEYTLFEDQMIKDVNQSLFVSDNIHFEYYYSKICSHCRTVKPDLLYFFLLNEDLEFYLFDLGELNGDVTIEGFRGTPTLYVIKDNEVIETYIGSLEIPEFIEAYNKGLILFE